MPSPLWHIDAFCEQPFGGNPAAVCLLGAPAEPTWMQGLAAEMNLSETAFLVRQGDGFALRWFTPTVEVDLCGHATLASAHALWEQGLVDAGATIRFQTRSGELTASRRDGLIWLDLPALPAVPVKAPPAVLAALEITPTWAGITGSGRDPVASSRENYLLVLANARAVRDVRPDFSALREATEAGVIITSRGEDSSYHFISRYFAPSAGIDEDPVTGSAHCTLGPYWAEQLGIANLAAFQASPRGGQLWVRVSDERVRVGGNAVTVVRGNLA
ncbi:MAG TPA: PhzF family phenazine biosynthesis protein [Chloroflexota bacterium]|nr:PhzF family phenazine biosynthesis protein [Chloroflexota bacterium]